MIDNFLTDCYKWYCAEIEKKKDTATYFYCLKAKGTMSSNDDGRENNAAYKRYRLSGTKTFDSLFFSEKASLLNQLDDFMLKKGKCAIQDTH